MKDETVLIRIVNSRGEVDVEVGAGISQGDPDFATNALGVTFLTFAQTKEGAPTGEGREIYLGDNRGQAFSGADNVSNNRVDEYAPRIALGRDGEPHLAWAQQTSEGTRVLYWSDDNERDDANRPIPMVAGFGDFPAIFVADDEVVHLVYTRDNDIFHNTNVGGAFTNERAVLNTPSTAESSLSMGVDPQGTVFVCYESRNTLYFAFAPEGQGFRPPRLLDTGGVVDPRMRVRSRGKLAIVYSKQGDLYSIVGQSENLNLPPRQITNTASAVETKPALDIDLFGNLHVSFIRDGVVAYINNACAPTADFAVAPSSGEAPLTVQFSDLSSGQIEGWEWDFGDLSTSNHSDPTHLYEEPGKYDVTLTVTAAGGRSTTVVKEEVVFVQTPENQMRIPDQVVLPGQVDVWFPVYADHAKPIQGFQVMATYDPNFLELTGHSLDFTSTFTLNPEFLELNGFETYFEVGCIFDFLPPFDGRQLGASNGRRLINVIFDVLDSAPQGAITEIRMINNRDISRIFNIFTIDGFSILPALSASQIRILPLEPPLPFFFTRGDVDRNRAVEITDGISLLNYLFLGGAQPRCVDAGDVNDDGRTEITDGIALLNFLFLGGAPPEIPFPNLGIDPTDDELADCF